ncbi:hypothetical protein [Novosphingobium pokkalii]|uniref:Uncharacterized protein n=1 Tax=Novosphingobium pokkalii TaxID=1770194 RepID=A0ABV7V430_9SPHN|nr:hypothetical protein [Novosphingobium pokkalii]GHC90495.1 hypothetical protein GCM10019060_14910 [Novosphingobium pokkalii]
MEQGNSKGVIEPERIIDTLLRMQGAHDLAQPRAHENEINVAPLPKAA